MIIKTMVTQGNTGYADVILAGKIVAEKRENGKIITWVATDRPLYALFACAEGIDFDR